MSQPAIHIPLRLDEVTADWFSAAMAARGLPPVEALEVLQVLHGTATKVRLRLSRSNGAGSALPETVWIKAGFENHSRFHQEVYAGEVRFYNGLAETLPGIPPRCYFAGTDEGTGASLIVLDDLLARGASLLDVVEPLPVETMRAALGMIASYHARHWMSEALRRDDYLAAGGAYAKSDAPNRKYERENVDRVSRLPRFVKLPAPLRDTDRMRRAMAALHERWGEAPFCLSHGDAHAGQAFRFPDGRFGLLDWQCAKLSNWAHDVAYFMISGLSVSDRRAHEDALLAHYLDELARRGVQPPPFEAARESFRLHALHGLGWALCPPELQPEDICTALTERFAAAVLDYGCMERLLG